MRRIPSIQITDADGDEILVKRAESARRSDLVYVKTSTRMGVYLTRDDTHRLIGTLLDCLAPNVPEEAEEAHQAGAGATNAPSPVPVEGREAERAGEGQEVRPARVRIAEASEESARTYEAAIRRAFAAARESAPPHAATDVMRRLLGEVR